MIRRNATAPRILPIRTAMCNVEGTAAMVGTVSEYQ